MLVVTMSEIRCSGECHRLLAEGFSLCVQRMHALPDGSFLCLRFLALAVMLVGLKSP